MKEQGFQKQKCLGGFWRRDGKKIHEVMCIISIGESKRKSLRKAYWNSIEVWGDRGENCDIVVERGREVELEKQRKKRNKFWQDPKIKILCWELRFVCQSMCPNTRRKSLYANYLPLIMWPYYCSFSKRIPSPGFWGIVFVRLRE